MTARSAIVLGLPILLALGCSSAQQEQEPTAPAPTTPTTGVGVDQQPAGTTPGLDSEATLSPTRWARRMQIDRLQASIPKVAGADINGVPITWRIKGSEALSDDVFGKVLGRPDYVTATEENPAPSSLYLKFVRDMARDVCTQIVDNDLQREQDHTLWRFAPIDGTATDEQLSDNLRYLVHRWLGLRLTADEPLIQDLRLVFDAGTQSLGVDPSSTQAQAEGWRGACIALFESPTFHLD